MKAVQLDIFGNDVVDDKRKTYRIVVYYKDSYAGCKEIKAYSEKQARYLFHQDKANKQYKITDCYEVK